MLNLINIIYSILNYQIPLEVFDKFVLVISLVVLCLRYFGDYKILDFFFAGFVGFIPYRLLKESPGGDSAIADIYLWQAFPVVLFFFVIWYRIERVVPFLLNTYLGQSFLACLFFFCDRLGMITKPVSEDLFLWILSRYFFVVFFFYTWASIGFPFWFFWLISTPFFLYKNMVKRFLLDELVFNSEEFNKALPEEPNNFNWFRVVAILSIASRKLYNRPVENKLGRIYESFTYPYIFKRYVTPPPGAKTVLETMTPTQIGRVLLGGSGIVVGTKQVLEDSQTNDKEKTNDFIAAKILHAQNQEKAKQIQIKATAEINSHWEKQLEATKRLESLEKIKAASTSSFFPKLNTDLAKLDTEIAQERTKAAFANSARRNSTEELKMAMVYEQSTIVTRKKDIKYEKYGMLQKAFKMDSTDGRNIRVHKVDSSEITDEALSNPTINNQLDRGLRLEESGILLIKDVNKLKRDIAPVVEESFDTFVKKNEDKLAQELANIERKGAEALEKEVSEDPLRFWG